MLQYHPCKRATRTGFTICIQWQWHETVLCNSPIETIMRFVKAPRQNGPKMAQQSRAASKKAQCQNEPKRPKKAELLSRYVTQGI